MQKPNLWEAFFIYARNLRERGRQYADNEQTARMDEKYGAYLSDEFSGAIRECFNDGGEIIDSYGKPLATSNAALVEILNNPQPSS